MHTCTHVWDFGKSKRQAEKRGDAGLLFVISLKPRLLQTVQETTARIINVITATMLDSASCFFYVLHHFAGTGG